MNEEVYEVENLYCTLCYHDLNHFLYNIYKHPILGVPLCILCYDKFILQSDDEQSVSDICSWCMSDDSELYICRDGNQCSHSFCYDCLNNNFGKSFIQNLKKIDLWTCLVCDPKPLEGLKRGYQQGLEQSIYHNQSLISAIPEIENENQIKNEVDPIIQMDLDLLNALVEESDESFARLEQESLEEKEAQIRDELRQLKSSSFYRFNKLYSLLSSIF